METDGSTWLVYKEVNGSKCVISLAQERRREREERESDYSSVEETDERLIT